MRVEIWFEFSSTYSYLTLMRAERKLMAAGVDFVWRPFLLGPILKQRGFSTSPFNLDPPRGKHMWRDVERRAALYGLPFSRPSHFPLQSLAAARVMTAALGEPWAGEFARSISSAAFARREDIADTRVIAAALDALGQDVEHWLARGRDEAAKTTLRARTEEAASHGIFGAPTFRIGRELFWGDDRLEEAILWALGHHAGLAREPDPSG